MWQVPWVVPPKCFSSLRTRWGFTQQRRRSSFARAAPTTSSTTSLSAWWVTSRSINVYRVGHTYARSKIVDSALFTGRVVRLQGSSRQEGYTAHEIILVTMISTCKKNVAQIIIAYVILIHTFSIPATIDVSSEFPCSARSRGWARVLCRDLNRVHWLSSTTHWSVSFSPLPHSLLLY